MPHDRVHLMLCESSWYVAERVSKSQSGSRKDRTTSSFDHFSTMCFCLEPFISFPAYGIRCGGLLPCSYVSMW
jgi:hypothetical protein